MCMKSALALLFGERRDTEPAGEVQEGKKCHRNACIQGGTFLLCVEKVRQHFYLANVATPSLLARCIYRFIWKWLAFPTTCLASLL